MFRSKSCKLHRATKSRSRDSRLYCEALEGRRLLTALTIAQENQLAGTPQAQWDVSGSGDSTIQGFATSISVNVGQTESFKVNDTASAPYHIDIYRMGYYQGNGARLVTSISSSQTLEQVQPSAISDATTGLVDAGNWAVSASWAVPADATSGIYFANVVREDTGGKSQLYFVVRNDASTSKLLFKTSDATWEAYNQWGGNSFYSGTSVAGSTGSSGAPDLPTSRAVMVSYNRPFMNRGQTFGEGYNSQPFYAEYPMVRWLEQNGYDVSYFTDVDTDLRGAEIRQHKVFMSVGHDEYWSGNERANVQAARDAGVNLAFFSGNEVYWKTRYIASTANTDGTDTSDRVLVCYKETWADRPIDPADPTTWTGTWRDPRFSPPADGGHPENALTGTLSMVDQGATQVGGPITVPASDAGLRFWRNTSVAKLTSGQTATLGDYELGYEWDEDLDNGSRPAGLIDLSSTTQNVSQLLLDWGSNVGPGTATHSLTLYKAASGALVFGAGTVQWSWGLDGTHDSLASTPDVNIRQATVNLFADMGAQPATLQAGLVAAVASTDSIAPTSMIASPTTGTSVSSGSTVTIVGVATDSGGGTIAGVEVSTDGGLTWHPATGRNTWTYTWTPGPLGSVTIKSRAVDDSGNLETPSAGISVTVTQPTSPLTLFGSATPAVASAEDFSILELGVRFSSDISGVISGIRFYKGAGNTGTHTGELWTAAGQLLATATFTGESASGWQQVNFANPVPITAGTAYVASYHTNIGHYAYTSFGFAQAGVNSGPLHVATDMPNSPSGMFAYGSGPTFPNQSFHSTNYYVDVVFNSSTVAPPVVTAETPAPGSTGVSTATTATATFNESIQPSTVSFVLTGPGGSVSATVGYNDTNHTVTLTPSVQLSPSTTYTAALSGAKDIGGTPMSGTVTWSFTTTGTQSTGPFSLWNSSATPAVASAADFSAVELGVKFYSDVSGFVTGIRFYKGAGNTGTHTGELWTTAGQLLATATFTGESATGWQQVNFANPVSITAGTTYVASYHTNVGNYSYTSAYFSTSPLDAAPLHAPATGTSGGNGVYLYGNGGFPNNTYNGNNYWVDVVFSSPASDTTPPTVTTKTPAPSAIAVSVSTGVSASFNESVQSSTISIVLTGPGGVTVPGTLAYNGSTQTATLTPNAQLAISTTYTVTVSGAKDLAGNTMTPVSWSFTTAAQSWSQTSVADFTAGTTNGTVVTNTSGGEIRLAQSSDDFTGTALSSAWTTTSWASLGGGPAAVSVSGGILSVGGAAVLSAQGSAGTPIEGSVSFSAAPFQHFGLATNLAAVAGSYWAIFSTAATSDTLFARVNAGGTTQDVSIGALPTGFHTYRVQPISGGFQFYVDGVLKTTINAAFPAGTALKAAFSEFGGAPQAPMQVDKVVYGAYVSSGSFTSTVFNAGRQATWDLASWTADLPAGTSITVSVRTGNTPTPDSTWSSPVTITNGGPLSIPQSQYLLYTLSFTTSDPTLTPVLSDITFQWH